MDWNEFSRTRRERQRPLVIAHRGVPALQPENTLASFALALEQGADVLETDLRFTQDKQIILFHDADLKRTTSGAGAIHDHTLREIKGFRTRKPHSDMLVKEEVPTLIELLEMTNAAVPLLLELKDIHFKEADYTKRLVKILTTFDMLERTAIVSFNLLLVRGVQEIAPDIPTGHITLKNPIPRPNTALLGPFWPLLKLNPFYVAWAHRMGSIVAPLDTNPVPRLAFYLKRKVDAVLADDPAAVVTALDRLNLHKGPN